MSRVTLAFETRGSTTGGRPLRPMQCLRQRSTRRPSVVAELKRLRLENRQQKMERDILKKATAFFAKENGEGLSWPTGMENAFWLKFFVARFKWRVRLFTNGLVASHQKPKRNSSWSLKKSNTINMNHVNNRPAMRTTTSRDSTIQCGCIRHLITSILLSLNDACGWN